MQVLIRGAGYFAAVEADLGNTSPPRIRTGVRVRIGAVELPHDATLRLDSERLHAALPGTLLRGVHDVSVGTAGGLWTTLPAGFSVVARTPDGGADGISRGGALGAGETSTSGGNGSVGGIDQVDTAGRGGNAGTAPVGGTAGDALPGGGTAGDALPGGSAGWDNTGVSGGAGASAGSTSSKFSCTQPVDSATISVYRFEYDLTDAANNHPANYAGSITPQFVDAPPNCGVALALQTRYFVYIGDHPDWDITSGSIDFWYLPGAISYANPGGILSRDADGSASPGHITFYQAGGGSGRIVVRMQDGNDLYLCSDEPIIPGVWTHIGLNFGPPVVELYVDGVLQGYTGSVPFYSGTVGCGVAGTHGIAGNNNFWVLGASADVSGEGSMDGLRGFLDGAAINALRISSVRRDFSR